MNKLINISRAMLYNICRLVLAMTFFLGVGAFAAGDDSVRLAIVADKASDPNKLPLLSLLEVKLSDTDSIELLERARIDSMLDEYKLSLGNLIQRDNIIKAGKLLRVDAFLLVSFEDTPEGGGDSGSLVRIRIIETSHGIRLVDTFELADEKEVLQAVERIAGKVDFAVQKLTIPPEESIAIGIVDIYRVGLADQHGRLAKILPAMLSSRLGREPRIIMLEREDLKLLSSEKTLTEGNDENFLNSAVLIDGYLHRNEQTNNLELRLHTRNAAGKEIGTYDIPINPNTLASAVNNVSEEIIKQIQSEPPTESWDPASEAKEFYRQGKLLKGHGRYPAAMSLLETTHALQPQNVYYTFELFENAWFVRFPRRRYENKEGLGQSYYYSDVELAEVVSVLVRQMQTEYDNGTLPVEYMVERLAVPLGLSSQRRNYFANPVSASTEQVSSINRSNRRIFVDTITKAVKDERNKPKSQLKWSTYMCKAAWLSSDDPDELMRNIKDAYIECLMPPELGGKINDLNERLTTCYYSVHNQSRLTVWYSDKDCAKYKAFKKLWIEYLKGIAEIDDPVLKTSINLVLANEKTLSDHWKTLDQNVFDHHDAKTYCNRAIDALFEGLNCPNEPLDRKTKKNIRELVRLCIAQAWRNDPDIMNVIERIFDPLIEKNDAVNIALWSLHTSYNYTSLFHSVQEDRQATSRYVNLLERIVKVLETQRSDKYVRTMLRRISDDFANIKKIYPDLVSHSSPKNITTTMLLNKKDWPKGQWRDWGRIKAHLVKDKLFVAFNESIRGVGPTGLAFAAIDLSRRRLIFRQRAGCGRGTVIVENGAGNKLNGSISGIAALDQKVYVSIRDVGLIEFDLTSNSTNPKILTQDDGLPSVSITSVAAVDGRLWVAYGALTKDSGLVIFDPAKQSCETILCSSLKSDEIFNSGQTYVISSMVYGPDKKLFFLVGERGTDVRLDYPLTEYWGLWKMDTDTRKLKHLWHNAYRRHGLERIDVFGDNWWLSSTFALIRFDPVLEKGAFVAGWPHILGKTKQMFEMKIDPFVTDKNLGASEFGHKNLGYIEIRTAAVHGDKMWARQGLSQLIAIQKDKSLDQADVMNNDILNGEPVLRFFSTPYGLVAIGEGTVGLIDITETEDSE